MSAIVEAIAAWLKSFGPVQPIAVTIPDTQVALGKKSRSTIYEAVGDGRLDAIKDGNKTLITVASIIRYATAMPPAEIAPMPPRQWTREAKARRQRERQQRKFAQPHRRSSSARISP
jgi:hypothetical protein